MPTAPRRPRKPRPRKSGKRKPGKPVKRKVDRLGESQDKPEPGRAFLQRFVLKFKMRRFDNLLKKIYGKSPMYYTPGGVERLIAIGEDILAKYRPIMKPIDRVGISAIVEKYKKEIEQSKQKRIAVKNRK